MKILSVNKQIQADGLQIDSLYESELKELDGLSEYEYIIISGGDGAIRRTIERLHKKRLTSVPKIIINPAGTFNVYAKKLGCKRVEAILDKIKNGEEITKKESPYYSINKKKIFLFSAGNSLDVAYIVCSELLRVGLLRRSKMRYLLAFLFLLPIILMTFPFFLINRHYYLVFSAIKLPIKSFLNLYFSLDTLCIDLKSTHTLMQLDGDLVIIKAGRIHVEQAGVVEFVVG